jgi:hypothetical protein
MVICENYSHDIYGTYGVHQPDDLKRQHILSQVIANFVNDIDCLACFRILKS